MKRGDILGTEPDKARLEVKWDFYENMPHEQCADMLRWLD